MASENAQLTRNPLQEGYLWPSADYDRQLEGLRRVIGSTIYLARLNLSEISLSVTVESKPVTLLD
ncbi:MAG: hypothetical protein PVF21_02840, partial [Thiohalophilus sp.]